MSDPPVVIAGERLKACLVRQVDRQRFGETDESLRELAILAREVARASTSEQAVLAFVLETVLDRWALDIGSRTALLSERAMLRQRFEGPINQAIAYLVDEDGDFVVIAETLVNLASAAF